MQQPDLDAVLHAMYMMELCRAVDRGATLGGHRRVGNDLGPCVGELDWYEELMRLLEESL